MVATYIASRSLRVTREDTTLRQSVYHTYSTNHPSMGLLDKRRWKYCTVHTWLHFVITYLLLTTEKSRFRGRKKWVEINSDA